MPPKNRPGETKQDICGLESDAIGGKKIGTDILANFLPEVLWKKSEQLTVVEVGADQVGGGGGGGVGDPHVLR